MEKIKLDKILSQISLLMNWILLMIKIFKFDEIN